MLCPKCDYERHRMWLAAQAAQTNSNEKYELRGGGASTSISDVFMSSASVKPSRGNSALSHVAVTSARASPAASVDVLDDAGQDGVCVGGASVAPYTDNGVNKLYRTVEINELLCFLSNKLHNHPVGIIKKAILEFYREDEILATKQLLLQVITDKSLPIQQYTRNRIGINKNKSTLEDIMNMWTTADEHNVICKLPVFCVADLSRIPMLNDELSDIALIKKTVFELEKEIRALSDIALIKKSVFELEKEVRVLSGNLAASKVKNNWLNNEESFPSLPSNNTISITRNITDPASHDADSAQMSTVIPNDKISESSTSQGPQEGQNLLNSSDNAPNYVDAVKSIPQDSDEVQSINQSIFICSNLQ